MTLNELLLWLSARKHGSWRQFRTAVEMIDLPGEQGNSADGDTLPFHLRIQLNLERTAHVEFDAAGIENGWRVVPPSLAISKHEGSITGVLCGARTASLLDGIERSLTREIRWAQTPQLDGPDVFRVQAPDTQTLIEAAQPAGILCQPDAPAALLGRLPPVTSLKEFQREALPATGKDWHVQQLMIERRAVKWRTITLQEAIGGVQGLLRFTRYQVPHYFLRDGSETIALPNAVGKYYLLSQRKKRVMKYDRREQSLTVPAIFRPPLLTERALILCSGFPPVLQNLRGRPVLTYREIPEDIAGMASEILRQDLS